ncbi:MAG: sugar phosphate isomerase/epimerase [Bacteroidales bacterium]|nr:sugar phosphate isomerase/epimerase [Bacteroidales bacterium]
MKTKQSRREFLRITAAGALGAVVLSNYSCKGGGKPALPGVGLQLYTIRDAMAADVPGSLKKVSDLGYKFVELADYADGKFYGYEPAEFKKMVNDLGLEIISSHTQVEGEGVTLDTARLMAEAHAKIGSKYCIQPWIVEEMRTTIDSYQRMAANWNQVGQIMKEFGMQFGYHNHNFEFATVEGKVPYFDVMLAELDKDLVIMELDMFWTTKAGHNPVDIIKKYPGRFHLFHLKDMYTREEPFFEVIKDDLAPVGAGVINFKEILAVKDIAGMKYMIVEQDDSRGDMWADVQTSITNMNTKILV